MDGEIREGLRKPDFTKPHKVRHAIHITPALSEKAMMEAQAWMDVTHMPVLVDCPDISGVEAQRRCRSCGGWEMVYLKKCKQGPYASPPGMAEPCTWYDGDGRYGRGWYTFTREVVYCPVCQPGREDGE